MKTWMKKLLSLCLVLFALSLLIPCGSVKAAEIGEEGYWSFEKETGVLTIYGSGEMQDYSGIVGYYPPWEEWDNEIKEIVISEGITTIGSEAFCGCDSLIRVSLPTTLTTIKDGAFWNCTSLETITLPQNVEKLDYYKAECRVFDGCSSLKEILVHEDNPYFTSCDGFLYNKSKTELIRCPEAFAGAYNIPEGTVKIARGAFGYCNSLTSVRIPATVKELGECVFWGCTSLQEADLRALTCEFPTDIFEGCTKLERITLSENYPYYKQDAQGALYAPDMSGLVFCCKGFSGNFAVPYGVKEIGDCAFEGCVGLKSAVLPETVERIGYSAFKDCSTLERVTIPNGVKLIDSYAFELCSALESVKIPGTVEAIEAGAFRYCTALRSISMDYGVKVIGYDAFEHCESITTVAIPNSVTLLDEKAFEGCHSLTSVILPGNSLEEIGINIFLDCESLCNVYFRGKAPSAEELEENWCLSYWDCDKVTLYYVEGQEGWTSPTLAGFLTAKWSGHVATDVVDTDYFYTPVQWAMETGITTGVGKDMFCPENTCTRGQIVTFLWRNAGCPEPKTTESPFTDISEKDYYYKAVLWAVEQGITNGVGHGRFNPEGTCTRGQVATFLWRAAGEPVPTTGGNDFSDVSEDAYYAKAVRWAVEQGITNGVGKGKFSPDGQCTRGQIVTFLWRAAGEPTVRGSLSPYATVIENMIAGANPEESLQEGTLADLDGDGLQELILMYYEGDYVLCDVYTLREGEAVVLMQGQRVQYTADGNRGRAGIAELDGKLYFYTFGSIYEAVDREGYEYAFHETDTYRFYALKNGELSIGTELKYDIVWGCNQDSYMTLLPESHGSINGEAMTVDACDAWLEAVALLRTIDGVAGNDITYEGFGLEELSDICR